MVMRLRVVAQKVMLAVPDLIGRRLEHVQQGLFVRESLGSLVRVVDPAVVIGQARRAKTVKTRSEENIPSIEFLGKK
jgi:hypothetical protein